MFKILLLSLSLLLCTFLSAHTRAHEINYEGNISLGAGLFAEGNWSGGPTTLSWSVFHPEGAVCDVFYSYTFEHPASDTFNFIFELRNPENNSGIRDVISTLPNFEFGTFDPASFPGLPEEVTGYRFWGESGSNLDTISFTSFQLPYWGDFYSGGLDPQDYAWNEGFKVPDPGEGGNGSLDGHVLVPGGIELIPEPNCVSFFIGTLVLLLGRRRRA